ncbi:unnamed protein product, partial [Peniophora sp. CBMAI 1063]
MSHEYAPFANFGDYNGAVPQLGADSSKQTDADHMSTASHRDGASNLSYLHFPGSSHSGNLGWGAEPAYGSALQSATTLGMD